MSKDAVLLVGPPAVGKTHLREALVAKGYFAMEFSKVMREVSLKSPHIKEQVDRSLSERRLLSDTLANIIFEDYLMGDVPRNRNIVVDGYPRTEAQADHLTETLLVHDYRIVIVFLDAPDEVLYARLLSRKTEILRADDEIELYKRFLETYRRNRPSLEEAAERVAHKVVKIDAAHPKEVVRQNFVEAVS